jgi:hypothetical protein
MLDLYHIAMSVNPELNILYRGWTFTLYQHCKLVIKININDFGLFCYWNFTSSGLQLLHIGIKHNKASGHCQLQNECFFCVFTTTFQPIDIYITTFFRCKIPITKQHSIFYINQMHDLDET